MNFISICFASTCFTLACILYMSVAHCVFQTRYIYNTHVSHRFLRIMSVVQSVFQTRYIDTTLISGISPLRIMSVAHSVFQTRYIYIRHSSLASTFEIWIFYHLCDSWSRRPRRYNRARMCVHVLFAFCSRLFAFSFDRARACVFAFVLR
jgi:hypothetical protein